MTKTFQEILDLRLATYPLIDRGLLSDNVVNDLTEQLVTTAGYEIDQFNEWLEN